MDKNRKIPSPWSQLGLYLSLLGGAYLFTSLLAAAILISKLGPSAGNIDPNDPRLASLSKFLQAISTITIFLVPALLYARITFRKRVLYSLGFRKPEKSSFYLFAITILFFSFPFEGWLGQLNSAIPLPAWMDHLEKQAEKQINAYLRAGSALGVLVNVIVIAVLPAICEEACFRGALQRILIQAFKSPWAGIIVSAIFFSAFHLQFQGFLPRMFLGVLLGAIYWYSGSLWTCIAAHFFTNGIQVIAVSFYPKLINETPSIPTYAALLSIVLVVGLLVMLRRQSAASYPPVYDGDGQDPHERSPG